MTDSKVQAVVANWYPRFLANGIDFFDLSGTLDAVDGWDDWADAWTATADRYDTLGRQALAQGHRVTAAEHLRRAAITLQFAQFVLTEDPPRRTALQERMQAVYRDAAPLLDPPAVRTEIPYGEDRMVLGYLRRPSGVDRPGLALLFPGLESTKEQFSTWEPFFLRRGMATLSIEGPGQGEGARYAGFRDELYGTAVAAVGEALAGLAGIDAGRVAVVGTSFGGYLALKHATRIPNLRGVVDIAGPYDLVRFDELQQVQRDGFRELTGAADEAETRRLLADVTLDGALDRLQVPVLVLHGERDTIIGVEHAHRIAAALGDRATVRLEPDGNHSCNNLATVVRPAVADWVTDRLGSSA